jgi:hypothetical protein
MDDDVFTLDARPEQPKPEPIENNEKNQQRVLPCARTARAT